MAVEQVLTHDDIVVNNCIPRADWMEWLRIFGRLLKIPRLRKRFFFDASPRHYIDFTNLYRQEIKSVKLA